MLGFILGPLMEENLRRSLVISRGDPMVFLERPISATSARLTVVVIALIVLPQIPQVARGGVPGVELRREVARSKGQQIELRNPTEAGIKLALSRARSLRARRPRQRVAQDYPNQDIRLICAFPAGGGADVLVRYFAEKLRPIVNRTVIVENKVGRRRQYRDRIRRARQTRRLHHLRSCRIGRRRQPEPVQEIRRSTCCAISGSRPRSTASRSCWWSTQRARTRPSPN